MNKTMLEIKNLYVKFPIQKGVFLKKVGEIKAVDNVSLSINKGETLGVVGESGSGKTTLGKAILNVLHITSHNVAVQGEILLNIEDKTVNLLALSSKQLKEYRQYIQMIFQDPFSSLNARMTAGKIIQEPLDIHSTALSKDQKKELVTELMDKVGLSMEHANRYPHEFSGGQRQRIGIARSLATNPQLVIADEPVSALDVSIQAQVINLMVDIQQNLGLSFIFIAHDLSVVEHISDRIAVMYLGKIVEIGSSEDVYKNAKHPYTKSLLSAIPQPDPKNKKILNQILEGDIPSATSKPSGCYFRTRCPIVKPECAKNEPQMKEFGNGHLAACPYV